VGRGESSLLTSDKNEQFGRKELSRRYEDPGKETGARNDENEPCNRAGS
jgi:hypothetical protein